MLLLKRLHFWVGVLGIIAFLLTGQYMMHEHGQLKEMADGPRMLLRSGHIYLLFASIINLLLGSYMVMAHLPHRIWLQYIISFIILLSPFVFLFGFFNEYQNADLKRPFSLLTLYALFGVAVVLIVIGIKALFNKRN